MFIFLAVFIIFVLILNFAIHKNNHSQENVQEQFWENERQANFTRRKDIHNLNYLTIPIEKIPQKAGKIFSWLFMVFMICNIAISSLALLRYNTRDKQPKAQNQMEQFFDTHYDDPKMAKIYPNAKSTN